MNITFKQFRGYGNLINDSLLINTVYLFGVLLTGSVFGVVTWAITARLYDQASVGVITAVISIAQLIAGIASLGMGMGLIRFLSTSDEPVEMINTTLITIFIIGLLSITIFLLGVTIWSPSLASILVRWEYLVCFVALILFILLYSLEQMVFQAYRNSKYAFWQVLIGNILRVLFTVIFLPMKTLGILLAVLISTIIGSCVGQYIFLPKVLSQYKFVFLWSTRIVKQLIPYSVGVHIAGQLSQAPILLTPPIILEVLGPEYSAKVYIVWMLGLFIYSPGQALAGSVFAESSITSKNRKPLIKRAIKISLFVTVATAILVVITSPIILNIFGKAYGEGSINLLVWLAVSSPLVSLNKIGFTVFQLENKIKKLIILTALSVLFFLLAIFSTISVWHLNSIGLAWMVSQVVVFIGCKSYLFGKNS